MKSPLWACGVDMSNILGKVEVVPHDSPLRCQYVHPQGQCVNKVVPGTERCPLHVATSANLLKESIKRNYRLAKLQDRVNDFADNPQVKSLREEVGILRLVLEEIVNRCQDGSDIILFAPRISEMVLRIEKLVSSCHRLEHQTGLLIDKAGAINIAIQIIEKVSVHVTDPDVLEKIGNDIELIISNPVGDGNATQSPNSSY